MCAIRPSRTGWLLAGMVAAVVLPAMAVGEPGTHYLTVVNDDDRSVVMIQIRALDEPTFTPVEAPQLEGGRAGQATVALLPGPCLRDLRFVYRDSTVLTVSRWNSCRQSSIHIGVARRAGLRQHPPA